MNKGRIPLPMLSIKGQGETLIKDVYCEATVILEYGSGGSSVIAARDTSAQLLSIESDKDWAIKMHQSLKAHGLLRENIEIRHIDIGPTREWGHPDGTTHWTKFHKYALAPWSDPNFSPDVILIDGRFRLASFAASLINASQPAFLIWDDYTRRNQYHVCEEILKPISYIGEMALFEIQPRTYNPAQISKMIGWFFTKG